jgi:hypothetical protein
MSLTSTVAYEDIPKARGFSVKGLGILVAGLVLGASIGLAIASFTSATDAPEVSVTVMDLDDFIRLNTTSLDGIAPAGSAVVVEPRAVDPHFLEANVGSLEYQGLSYTEPSSGLR